MAQLHSDLLIKLTDRASGPARGILGLMNRLRSAGARAGGGLARMGDGATRSVGVLHAKLLAATAAAYGLKRSLEGVVSPAANFETRMLDIGQKSDLSASGMEALGARIRKMAVELGRGANEVGEAVDTMMGFGLTSEQSMSALPAIVKTATAYGAQINDIAQASYFAINNLKVPAQEIGKALEVMASAGKDGGFELKDMAAQFPAVTAAAQGLGMTGVTAVSRLTAALQIARDAASSGSEATTNVQNLLQKIQSQDAVKKWKKFGVDIRKEVQKTQKSGGDMFEMIATLVQKHLKGDLGKLGDLYQDNEVQKFLRPLIQGLSRYIEIRDRAFKAQGGIQKDYEARLRTFQGAVRRLSAAFEELRMRMGDRLLGPLTRFVSAFGDRLVNIDKSVGIFDKLGAAVRGLATGILGPGSDGGLADAFGKLGDLIFGRAEDLSAETDRMGQSFERFRQMGAALREFAASVGAFVGRFQELTGLDFSALAKWGLTLGAAAVGVSLFAKAIRGLASAIALLTGMKALWSGAKWIKSIAGRTGEPPQAEAVRPVTPKPKAPVPAPATPGQSTQTGRAPPPGSIGSAGKGSVPGAISSKISGIKSLKAPTPFGPWNIADLQRRFAEMTKPPPAPPALPALPQPSLLNRFGGSLKYGLFGAAMSYIGEKLIDATLDGIDKAAGVDGSDRIDPGLIPTLKRLKGHFDGLWGGGGTNMEQGAYERSRRRDEEFRRDPEAARGRAMAGGGQASGEPRNQAESKPEPGVSAIEQIKMSIESLAEKILPKGTQDVRVTNPPPAPVITNHVTVTVSTNASPAEIGSAVAKAVGQAAKRGIQGANSDAGN